MAQYSELGFVEDHSDIGFIPEERAVSESSLPIATFGGKQISIRPESLAGQVYQGGKKLWSGKGVEGKAAGVNQIIAGLSQALIPLGAGMMLPALAAAPLPTLAGAATAGIGGFLGGETAKQSARLAGAGPEVQELAGTGGGLVGGVAGGVGGYAATKKVGKAAATGLANTALETTRKQRAFGTNPGKAALEETKGIRSETIQRTALDRIAELNAAKQRELQLAPAVSLRGARSEIARGLQIAAKSGNLDMARELQPMLEALSTNQVTNTPYGRQVPASQAFDILKGFDDQFVTWKTGFSKSQDANKFARAAWRQLRNEIRAKAPGTLEIDKRLQSLGGIPGMAEHVSTAPGMVETAVNRGRAATGALLPMLAGTAVGGPTGGAAVLAGQEALSQPAVRMGMARLLWRGSGGGKVAAPVPLIGPPVAPPGWTPPSVATSGPTGTQPSAVTTGATNTFIPVVNPSTGQVEYVPQWMLQKP